MIIEIFKLLLTLIKNILLWLFIPRKELQSNDWYLFGVYVSKDCRNYFYLYKNKNESRRRIKAYSKYPHTYPAAKDHWFLTYGNIWQKTGYIPNDQYLSMEVYSKFCNEDITKGESASKIVNVTDNIVRVNFNNVI